MKSLMGYTSKNDVEMQGLANNLCEGHIEALANRLNECVVSVSNNLPRLMLLLCLMFRTRSQPNMSLVL